MAIRTYDILLDSYNSTMPEPIVGRQGDKNGAVTLHVTITDRGTAVDLTGQKVNLIAETAKGTAVVADNVGVVLTDPANGRFDYAVPNALWSEAGKIKKAYFSLNDSSGQQTTYDLIFIVKRAIDITKEKADDYITIIDGTLRDLSEKVNAVNNAYNNGDFYNKTEIDRRAVDVKTFGAVGDGSKDDTAAIKNAINSSKAVYFPAGHYIVSDYTALSNVVIYGHNAADTIIETKADKVIFLIHDHVRISGVQLINKTVSTANTPILQLGDWYRNGEYSGISDVIITGDTTKVGLLLQSSQQNTTSYNASYRVFSNYVRNLIINDCYSGITLDSINLCYVNGNHFSNISILNPANNGVKLTSSGSDYFGISHNMFNDVQIEFLQNSKAASGVVINNGQFNYFDRLNLWDDVGGSTGHAIDLSGKVGSDGIDGNFSNHFNGIVESDINASDELKKANVFSGLTINSWNTKAFGDKTLFSENNKVSYKNLIPNNVISLSNEGNQLAPIFVSGSAVIQSWRQTLDNCGEFLPINVSSVENQNIVYYHVRLGEAMRVGQLENFTIGFKFHAPVSPQTAGDTPLTVMYEHGNLDAGTDYSQGFPTKIKSRLSHNLDGSYTLMAAYSNAGLDNTAGSLIFNMLIEIAFNAIGDWKLYDIVMVPGIVMDYSKVSQGRNASEHWVKVNTTNVNSINNNMVGFTFPGGATNKFTVVGSQFQTRPIDSSSMWVRYPFNW